MSGTPRSQCTAVSAGHHLLPIAFDRPPRTVAEWLRQNMPGRPIRSGLGPLLALRIGIDLGRADQADTTTCCSCGTRRPEGAVPA